MVSVVTAGLSKFEIKGAMTLKQTGKRLLAVLLAMALCLSLFPVMASAEEAAEPVSIASLDEITDMNGSYKLSGDITVTEPLGSSSNKFNGTFDGDGHTVTINIEKNDSNVGMFAYLDTNAVVKNFVVDTATVTNTSGTATGAIAGTSKGTISDIRVKEIAVTSMEKTGGLVGVLESGATLTRCCIDGGTVKKGSTSDTGFGGLVGESSGTVSFCSAGVTMDHSAAKPNFDYNGGIVGKNTYSGTITDCYFSGSFNEGSNKSYKIGGICGDASGTIKNCYFSGSMTTQASTKNPITNISTTNCYYLNTSFTDYVSSSYATKKTAAEFATLAEALGKGWENGTDGFPVLSWQTWKYSTTAIKYKIETYLQNVEDDGYALASTEEKRAEPGTAVAATAAELEGFTFDAENANNVTSGSATADLVLKLYYTRNSYTLTWSVGEGKITSADDAYTHGTVKFEAPITYPTVKATGKSVKWDKELKTMPATDTTVTASYTEAVYDVIWNANGGKLEKSDSWSTEQVETLKWTNYGSSGGAIYGQTLSKYKWNANSTFFSNRDLPTPIHTSKVFDGWYTAAEGGELVTADTVVTEPVDGSFTYYAHWTDGWTVTFDPDGGSVSPKTVLVKKGTAIGSANIPTPTRSGYDFDGWYHGEDKLDATTVIDADVTYTAKWTPKTFTVTFNANGGTGTMEPQTFTYGVAQKLSKNLFTREGYRFLGWATWGSATAANYTDEQEYTIGSYNQTLYAVWEEVKYRLSFELTPADATVVVKNANGYTQSATNGVYNLSEGKYTYTVSAYGYETATGEINLNEDTVKPVSLTKIPTYAVTFNVTKPDGTGETQITVTDADGKVMTADENGVYNLMAGKYSYLVKAKGATKAKADFTVEDEALTFDITLNVQKGWDGETMTEPNRITADEATGAYDGMTGWYRIESGEQLAWFANKVNSVSGGYNGNAVLAKDIDLGNAEWKPMGEPYNFYFTGIFDGNGHTIKNLCCEGTTYQGLFGYSKGTIRNLTVYGDVWMTAGAGGYEANAGGIVAYQNGGRIENCASYVNVTNENDTGRTGGVVAYASGATVGSSYNAGTLTGGKFMAGVVGYCSSNSTVKDCYNIGTLIGSDGVEEDSYTFAQMAGIASNPGSSAVISNCYNAGALTNIEKYSRVGAILSARGDATLTNCYYLEVEGLKGIGNGLQDGATAVTAEKLASSEMPGKLSDSYKANTGCGNVAPLLKWQTIPEHRFGATASDVQKTPATCTEAATYYVKCDVCGAVSDDQFVTVGEPNGHSFTTKASDQKASDATCTEAAKYYVQCDNCDAVSDTVTIAVGKANGHSFTTKASDQKASDATCTEPATYYVKCDNCDAVSETETVAVGTANGHTEVIDAAVEPTCTEPGKTEGKHCSVCNEVLVKQEVVAAKGHTYENGVCTVCGAKDPDYVAPAWNNPFNDVAEGDWFYEGVKFVHQSGLFNGTAADTFSPNAPMTRGMLVSVLWRLDGKTAPKAACTFTDVDAKAYYADAVAWAAENGVVNGIGESRFAPEGEVTREQIAAILSRYAESKNVDTSKRAELASFPDAGKVSTYAKDAMAWAVENGLVNGIKNGSETTLAPQGTATRAQVAAILARYVQNIAK